MKKKKSGKITIEMLLALVLALVVFSVLLPFLFDLLPTKSGAEKSYEGLKAAIIQVSNSNQKDTIENAE